MIKLLKKTGAIFFTAFIVWSFSPMAFAQTEVPSPLDDIKSKLEGEGIEVIDYSENKWGKLPDRIVQALIDEYKLEDNNVDIADVGLSGMYQDIEALAEGPLTDQKNLDDAILKLREKLSEIEFETGLISIEEGGAVMAPLSTDDIDLVVNEAIAYKLAGERQLRDVVMSVTNAARNLIGGLAVLWIVISGIRMAMAGGDETTITEQKKSIFYAVIGLVAILLIERMIDILYGPLGTIRNTLDVATTTKFSVEILGLVSYIKAIFGTLAILMITISGIKTIFALGEEEKIKKQKQAIFWIIIGFVLVLINKVIVENIFIIPVQNKDQISASNITAVINMLGTVIQFALGFVGLFALGALIFGAGTMIANYGNEEMVQKSKKMIKNAIIGIIIIISAYTLVATLIVFK